MKLNVIGNDIVNIEGLNFRQLALVERAIRYASREGGYEIDIDDLVLVMEGFKNVDVRFDKVENRIDKLGLQIARLEDDAPTIEALSKPRFMARS